MASGDLALTVVAPALDLAVEDGDLLCDRTLRTAVLLSLFTDERIEGERGWWGDEFLENADDRYGSKLWRFERAKRLPDTPVEARQYALDALKWLLSDGVAGKVDVVAEASRESLSLAVSVEKPDGAEATFRFQHVWDAEGWEEIGVIV